MVTEIRELGDKETLVVYTDENEIAAKLASKKRLLKVVEYEQGQPSKRRVALVGKDFYFPKQELRGLLRVTGLQKGAVFS